MGLFGWFSSSKETGVHKLEFPHEITEVSQVINNSSKKQFTEGEIKDMRRRMQSLHSYLLRTIEPQLAGRADLQVQFRELGARVERIISELDRQTDRGTLSVMINNVVVEFEKLRTMAVNEGLQLQRD